MGSRAGDAGLIVSMATNTSGATECTERLMPADKASAGKGNSGAKALETQSLGGVSWEGKK